MFSQQKSGVMSLRLGYKTCSKSWIFMPYSLTFTYFYFSLPLFYQKSTAELDPNNLESIYFFIIFKHSVPITVIC